MFTSLPIGRCDNGIITGALDEHKCHRIILLDFPVKRSKGITGTIFYLITELALPLYRLKYSISNVHI
jgi:hypothetical protein